MDILILGGYRNQPIGIDTADTDNGELWIDFQIRTVKELGLSPIVVLSGAHADEVLRVSRELENCELVFDVNGSESNLFSNLKAGLHATDQACFVLPLEVPAPTAEVWKNLKMELVQHGLLTKHHILQFQLNEGAPWQYGFPLLVSAVGNKAIRNMKNATGLTDERIGYRQCEFRTPAA